MKKKFNYKDYKYGLRECSVVMKFTILFILISVFQVRSEVKSQEKLFRLKMNDVSLIDVLKEIEKQGNYTCLYSYKEVAEIQHLNVDVNNVSIQVLLEKVLKGTNLQFKIVDQTIVIQNIKVQPDSRKAEQRIIKGRVLAKDRTPLPGVTVLIKGTSIGVVTDTIGNYKITLPDQKDITLVFSFIGMVTKEVKVTNQKEINVTLEEDVENLEEVVVTGYNNIRSTSFTGNTVTVKRDDLLKVSKTNVIKAIQVFDPSFRIKENNRWGSDPNAIPEVYIRGESGITGTKQLDRDPLDKSNLKDNPNLPTFIMDGFEISVTKLYDYDPNRIESITILKDAAATAMYGSRAANGVVIITTVTPKAGQMNVSYNLVGDVTMPDLSDYDLLNAEEKLEVERLAGYYVVNPESNYQRDEYELNKEYNEKLANIKRGVDTYWLSKPLRTVFNHKHSLYIDGGNENFRFGLDLQYSGQDGVMKGSGRNVIGAGLFVQYVYKTLSIRNNISFMSTKSKESPYGLFSTYAKQLPYNEYRDDNGNYLEALKDWGSGTQSSQLENPLYEPSLRNFDKSSTEEWTNNLSVNWNIYPSLLLKGQISIARGYGDTKKFIDPLSKKNTNKLSLTNLKSGELHLSGNDNFNYNMYFSLSYNGAIGNHMINALAGVEVRESQSKNESSSYYGFPSGELSSPEYAEDQPDKTKHGESTSRSIGMNGSVNYSYKDIYLLDASIRVDGSSAFGKDKRYAPFWSAGVGINLHKFDFFQSVGYINQLKIRASFGQTGKVNFPPYAAKTSYQVFTDEWHKTGYGASLKALGNKNLTWETTNTLDIGGEISLFDDFIYLKGSYYDKKTIDLVTDVTVPSSTGFTSYRDNIGEISNRGYELDFRVHAIKSKDMNLVFNANLSHNKNKILKISESLKAYNRRVIEKFEKANQFNAEVSVPFLQYQEGGSLNSIWGIRSMGINPADGQEVFIKKDGQLSNAWVASDQVVLGNEDPKARGAIGINFVYKQFSLFTSFLYEFGGDRYNQTLVDKVENVNVYTSNVDRRVLTSRWTQPGDKAKFKGLAKDRSTVAITRATSRFVQKYNALSWSSIELGYDLNADLISKYGISMLRFTFGMNDLVHLSNVKQERGLDYPFARKVEFSIKMSF